MNRPIRLLAVVLALVTVVSTGAHAQINLAWNNCITQGSAAANLDYACDGSHDGIRFKLVPSFVSPANLSAFVGIQMVLDVHTVGVPAPVLPDYWKLGVGECRNADVTSSFVVPGSLTGIGTGTTGVCRNPWAGAQTAGGFQWNSGQYTPDHARVLVAIARSTAVALTAAQQYVAGVFEMDAYGDIANDAGIAVCSGCCMPLEFDLQTVELYQTAGTLPQDVYSLSTPATRNFVTWQASHTCTPTPVARKTWGSIKTLYR